MACVHDGQGRRDSVLPRGNAHRCLFSEPRSGCRGKTREACVRFGTERFGFAARNAHRCLYSVPRSGCRAKTRGSAVFFVHRTDGEALRISSDRRQTKRVPNGTRFVWRRRRDSNSRTAFDRYTISSRAPSTKLGDFSKGYLIALRARGSIANDIIQQRPGQCKRFFQKR